MTQIQVSYTMETSTVLMVSNIAHTATFVKSFLQFCWPRVDCDRKMPMMAPQMLGRRACQKPWHFRTKVADLPYPPDRIPLTNTAMYLYTSSCICQKQKTPAAHSCPGASFRTLPIAAMPWTSSPSIATRKAPRAHPRLARTPAQNDIRQ